MNKENKTVKKIGVDARFYGPLGKGLGRYTKELLDRLLEKDRENHYVVFLSRDNFTDFETDNPRVKKVLAPFRWYTLAEQIFMPYYIWREKLDLIHFHHFNIPVFCPAKFVVTIHDLILIKYPSRRASRLSLVLYVLKNLAYKFVLRRALYGSEKIIAVSEFTKKDILQNFNIAPDKVKVTYEGVAESLLLGDNRVSNKDVLNSYGVEGDYLLYVGNAYPHKNLEWLIELFARHQKELAGFNLVLVGKKDYFFERLLRQVERLEDEALKKKIIFPGFVPDSDLAVFFRSAYAYVFPSKYEGFGIPPLEAMANFCPVISSDRASMPEILGEGALYFDPEDPKSFLNNLRILKNKKDLRQDLLLRGQKIVAFYSWDKCSEKTLRILNSI